ncbi:MAG: hypothetical protein H7645_04205 [Candidatus Heimdallarchaeota archaeon]|nr:hypothetical protein [Candidatus Heimdallarchaeota archaeon]MCK4769520.1 hypothetical protein [Candidatus Heimdallarchaeota archaeon]
MIKIPPKKNATRSSNVYTINIPSNFKDGVLERSKKFGGASQLITMSLGDLASRIHGIQSKLDIMQELRDYIKLEILLMQRYEEESQAKKDTKLSFRIKDEISQECLTTIRKKTGWSTSKSVRVSLLWYLYANFDELVASDSYVPLLTCPDCDFRTHDQRVLGVHAQTVHASAQTYDTAITTSQTTIDQFTTEPISDIEIDETKLLQELGLNDLGTLQPTEEAEPETISPVPDTLVDVSDKSDLKEIIEERIKERRSKKDKDEKIDELQSEISDILESLREDGLIDD